MAKLNAVEADLDVAKILVADIFDGEVPDSISTLFESSEMGMRSFRALSSVRPLIAAIWQGMSERGEPNRFAVERMLKDIDEVLGYWIVPDDEPIEVEEGGEKNK